MFHLYRMRKFTLLGCLLLVSFAALTQVKSPDTFLGYSLGTNYTLHANVVQYFEQVAAAVPERVILKRYGSSYEGRPLIAAFITNSENLKRLEDIRVNNLRLAQLSGDNKAATEEAPAIVWLSYNVHGNETSSSEAAMRTLFHLVNDESPQVREWLKKTVVVIDPCLNPDGRDRYVNWFKGISGKQPNPSLDAREHYEPWPGGRTNHYYFDLNRDWAWQTQQESKQRMALYREWMPQVHVDYHEQGIDAPYYFAPAAEPYHQVITPFQRAFQDSIGRNHARYFDAKGWVYFTKLRFDLLYPSYGDTYPTFNGAIGMTYEQGGIGAGLAVQTSLGDTLTLRERVEHHHTTALSTIEAAARQHKLLIREFRKYFSNAVSNSTGLYKTFFIRREEGDDQKIVALKQLLDLNGIRYGAYEGTVKAYHYASGADETVSFGRKDLAISAGQPRSALVQVLFEPNSKLSDSVTYDITAWSIPYVFGLNAYASTQPLPLQPTTYNEQRTTSNEQQTTSYAYVIKWEGIQSAKAAGLLLQKGLLLRYSELPFTINGEKFNRGSIIILKTNNRTLEASIPTLVQNACEQAGVRAWPVSTGMVENGADFGSDLVIPLQYKRVVLLSGEGTNANAVGALWHFFEEQLNYPITLVECKTLSNLNWNKTDVIILPGGSANFLEDKANADALREWVSKGGKLIALESAVSALSKLEWGLKTKKTEETDSVKDPYEPLKLYQNRERDFVKKYIPGAIYKVEMDTTHPLAFGYRKIYYTLKQNDQLYEFLTNGGWNVGVIKKQARQSGFVGSNLQPKLKDGLIFGVQPVGQGSVVYLADDILFRSFWENGKLMLCNAVFFQ